jgi:hypothetical protein
MSTIDSFVVTVEIPIILKLSIFFVSLFYAECWFKLTHNGLQLGEVAEVEAQMFSFAQKLNRRTELEFSTNPAILPNCC